MSITARLVDVDGVTELIRFGPSEPVALQALDFGYPEVRESSVPIPGRDGEFDTTAYTGASAISLQLMIRDDDATTRDVWLDRIRGYCAPRRRSYLHITKDGWPAERRTLVRGTGAPVTFQRPGWLPIQVGFRAPEGLWESTVLSTVTLFPTASAAGGISFPLTFPIELDPGNVDGAALVTNSGTVTAYPVFDIYGFCTNPQIVNLTTGEEFSFLGLTVQAGEFIRVDMGQRLALLDNDRALSRYSLLDFTTSSWWGLPTGSSLVAFVPGNPGASCQALMSWRDTTI